MWWIYSRLLFINIILKNRWIKITSIYIRKFEYSSFNLMNSKKWIHFLELKGIIIENWIKYYSYIKFKNSLECI